MKRGSPICPVCEAAKNHFFISFKGMDLLECETCALIFMAEMPSISDLDATYVDVGELDWVSVHKKAETKMRRLRRRARTLAGYTPRRGRFLDVGSGAGFMTEAMRDLGFEAHGVEPGPALVAYACEHYPENTYNCTFIEEFDAGGLNFDSVYCSEVIEHSVDVNRFINAIHRVMEPGGILYLTTPDISHWRRPRDVVRWIGFNPPIHCIYFNPAALVRFLEKHGFRTLRRRLAFKPGIKIIAAKL